MWPTLVGVVATGGVVGPRVMPIGPGWFWYESCINIVTGLVHYTCGARAVAAKCLPTPPLSHSAERWACFCSNLAWPPRQQGAWRTRGLVNPQFWRQAKMGNCIASHHVYYSNSTRVQPWTLWYNGVYFGDSRGDHTGLLNLQSLLPITYSYYY